jgi:hypothetical protein
VAERPAVPDPADALPGDAAAEGSASGSSVGGTIVTDESSMLGAAVGDASELVAFPPPQPASTPRASSVAATA